MESRVHPDLREMLAMSPGGEFKREELHILREAMGGFGAAMMPEGDYAVSDKMIPGPSGAPDIRVRIYEPGGEEKNRPGILYIHGGGYIVGTPEFTDLSCIRLVMEIGCVIASVDYRLAPEHPYPAPLEDCYAALTWFSDHAVSLDVDAERIAVVGGSAGGGLVAGLSLLVRDKGGPKIAFQAPLYPMIDDRNITPSSYEFTDPRLWNRSKNEFGWQMYLGDLYGGDVPIYAAPARAEDLSGLPPTYTFVGELDLFRDETTDYALRLMRAGVPTEYHIYSGCIHGFDMAACGIGRRAENELIEVLKNALA